MFFLGIATLKATFAGLDGSIDLAGFVGDGAAYVALFVLAGFVLMFVALLTLIGTMISDVLLVLLDPRIRYEGREA